MDLRAFLDDLKSVFHLVTDKPVKEFVSSLEKKVSYVPRGEAQQYVIACVFQQLQASDAVAALPASFKTKYPPRFPDQHPVSLDTLKLIYDATDEILFVTSHPRIDAFREHLKDHVLKTVDAAETEMTWNAKVKEYGMINVKGLKSLEHDKDGLLPITNKTMTVFNHVIANKQTVYSYDDKSPRRSQRVRALQAMHAQLTRDFVTMKSQTENTVNVVSDNYYRSIQKQIAGAGSADELIKILPKLIEDICHQVYVGLGPDVPFDLTFWTWYQKKKIIQNAKAVIRAKGPSFPYDQLVTSFDFQAVFQIDLVAK